MFVFRPTIASRLIFVMALASGAALAFSCTAFIWSETGLIRAHKSRETDTVARLLANGIADPLQHKDPSAVQELLNGLVDQPAISYACVFDRAGQKMAEFNRRLEPDLAPPRKPAVGKRFIRGHIEITRPIVLGGRRLGDLFVRAATVDTQWRAYRFGAIAAAVTVASLGVAIGLALSLQKWIAHPLAELAATAQRISEEGNYSLRVERPQSTDEIALLCDQFNRMLERIEQGDQMIRGAQSRLEERVTQRTQQLMEVNDKLRFEIQRRGDLATQLIEVSRTAGMAEVANGVLHNVGNVLNSVTVSASLIRETARRSEAADLIRVLAMIEENRHDLAVFLAEDERGRRLPDYLAQAALVLEGERQSLQKRADELCKNVEHIKDVIATQQSYTGLSGVLEKVDIVELIDDAVQINSTAIEKRQVEVVKQFAVLPTLVIDKRKVLQILVNLIKNAVHAVEEQDHGKIEITLIQDHDWARICVRDNGIGIDPKNRDRIFQHGFTTRRQGHGLGLHSGAISAQELGGSIKVQSDGIGHGAAFTLSLPLRQRNGASAASDAINAEKSALVR